MKKNIAPRKKLKRKNNPITSPGNFVRYGSTPYKVLSYARFRKGRSFTTTDYREFMLKQITPERTREAVNFLSDIGYLEKFDNPNPTHPMMKNMFTITLSGEHALMYLGRKERERELKRKTKTGQINGTMRWRKEQQVSRFSIGNK
jgi:hypothetical protein